MATAQDASIGLVAEATYKTGVTVTRWYEYLDETLDWSKTVKQGLGLRVAGRVARSARRVVPTAMGTGDFSLEVASKGLGVLFDGALGASTVTLVSGSTWQHNFVLGDTPKSFTVQKGVVEAPSGTVDPITFLGCMIDTWELDFPNADIAKLKCTLDIGDITTATGYAAPSYPAAPVNLFHFAGGTIFLGGTLTAPTTVVMGTVTGTAAADVRGGSLVVANNLRGDRFNLSGGGRKSKPTVGLRSITGKLDIEYDSTTFRDAMINETPMALVLNYTAGALSAGLETLQVIIPEIKFDSQLPMTNGTDLIVQNMSFTGLDNLTAAQPIYVSMRTSDAAL